MVVVLSTIETLTLYAEDVLSVAETALALTDAGVPDRSYISPAAPTFDCCPALMVYVSGLQEASTSPLSPSEATARRTDFGNIIMATYSLSAIRCAAVPDQHGNPPPAVDIQATAVTVQQDGWTLWNGFRDAIADGEIFDGCLGAHFLGGTPIAEQGGCCGWTFTLRASIPGIL